MKSFRKERWFQIPSRRGFVKITSEVSECIQESRVSDGLVLVNSKHI